MKSRYILPGALFAASLQTSQATVTSVGVDTTTAANWRTAANVTFQADAEYGTSGYVVFGLNTATGIYTQPFNVSIANTNNAYNLPAGISVTTIDSNIGMWSGNGNFGNLEDPGNGNAITPAPLLANSLGPKQFTISRSHTTPMRLTLLTASGDGAGATYSPSVNDGSGAVSTSHTHTVNGVVYHVFDISSGFSDIVISITSAPNWSLTGMAFDDVLPPPVTVNWVKDGGGNWSDSANWDAAVPNAVSARAGLASPPLTGPATVTLDVPVTLGALGISGFETYTLAGSNALTLDNGGLGSAINVADGLHEISAPVVLIGNATMNPGVGSELTLSGTLTGTSTFGIAAPGTVKLSGDFSAFTGGFAINNSGVLEISPSTPLTLTNPLSGNGSLMHSGTGLVTISGFNTWSGGLIVTGGGSVSAGSTVALGTGPVTLADGTLTITGDSNLGNRNLPIGSGDGTLVIPTGVTVTSRAPGPAGGGELVKSGGGAWVIPLGVGASSVRLDISQGSADLRAVDTYGTHSQSNLTLRIGPGALVTNGAAAPAFEGFNAMGALELEGGELRATNGISVVNPFLESGLFEAYGIRNSIVVTGTAPSLISDVGQAEGAINIGGIVDIGDGFNSPLNIDVEDVTTSTASDLIVSAKLQDNGSAGFARLKSGIVKSGAGTLELSGVNIFTGNTQIDEGGLLLAASGRMLFVLGASSGTSNQLSGAGTASIEGDFAIETAAAAALSSGMWTLESVSSLAGPYGTGFEVTDPDGTPWTDAGGDKWTKDGGEGKTWTFDETTGVLELTSGGNFASWALTNSVTGGADGDSDNDGIPNLFEYALNLNPAGSDGSAGTFNGSLLSFAKRAEAVTNGDVTYAIQESDDLGAGDPWETVTPTVNDAMAISYTLPGGGPRKFARLLITQVP
jgi:autotransporter-associated beta strand protein